MSKLKKDKWYLFCNKPHEGDDPIWVGRFFERIIETGDYKNRYLTYIFAPNGSKDLSCGIYSYCIPVPKLPKVKLK